MKTKPNRPQPPDPKIIDPDPMATARREAAKIVFPELPPGLKETLEVLKAHDANERNLKTPADRIAHINHRKKIGAHINILSNGNPNTPANRHFIERGEVVRKSAQKEISEIREAAKKIKIKK